MLISTAFAPNQEMLALARELTDLFAGHYIERRKHSITKLFALGKVSGLSANRLLIVEKNDLKLYEETQPGQAFFFHPSMAALRIGRLQRGEPDPLVEISQLRPGESFLDCTLGIGSDTLVAAYALGPAGQVLALESDQALATIVGRALRVGGKLAAKISANLAPIEVVNADYNDFLPTLADRSFDVVYFDPMFKEPVAESVAFEPLRAFANPAELNERAIAEARRIARKRVILKAEKGSSLFTSYGFKEARRSADFSYGVIELAD